MHAAYDAEFAGSHLCHASEYWMAAASDPVPAAGAWMDSSCGVSGVGLAITARHGHLLMGRYLIATADNCERWTSSAR